MGIANFGVEAFIGWANQKRIEEYIRNQLQEDVVADQLSLFEEYDPFTGEKNKRKYLKRPQTGQLAKVVLKGTIRQALSLGR